MIPSIITLIIFCWFINFYDSKLIYFGYLYFFLLSVLCSQSLGHISGIIFNNDQKIALLFSITLLMITIILGNSIIPIKEFHYSLQWLSELSYHKLSFESILIMIYGFDRCASDEFSTILYGFDIEDKKFWPNVRKLFVIFIVLKFISLIALILKTNSVTKRSKVNETQISFEESKSKLDII